VAQAVASGGARARPGPRARPGFLMLSGEREDA